MVRAVCTWQMPDVDKSLHQDDCLVASLSSPCRPLTFWRCGRLPARSTRSTPRQAVPQGVRRQGLCLEQRDPSRRAACGVTVLRQLASTRPPAQRRSGWPRATPANCTKLVMRTLDLRCMLHSLHATCRVRGVLLPSMQWPEAKKASYVRHAMREYHIHKELKHPRCEGGGSV